MRKSQYSKPQDELYIQQCKFMKEIFATNEQYKQMLKYKLFQLKYRYTLSQNNEDNRLQIEKIERQIKGEGSLINLILSLMTTENSWLIEKYYLDSETKNSSSWYLDYFSKSTFYKRKRQAIQEFLNYYFTHVDE